MEIVVLPPHDQFILQCENQNRRQHTANNPEREGTHAHAHMFSNKIAHNQFAPVSYGILPSPSNHLQFPPVNNLQFMHGNNLHFPCGNIPQICSGNGVQNSSSWPFSSPSPECEIPKNNLVFGLLQPSIFPYHHSPSPAQVGRRWHSMPEGCVLYNRNYNESGKGASLFRSRSVSIPSTYSSTPASPKLAENGLDEYKKAWPWQEKRSPKPFFEWKWIDSGPPNEGSFGPEKQRFSASHKPTNQKRYSLKKAMNGGRKNNNTRYSASSEGKGITLLKRPPKSELQVGVNNLIQALGESTITDIKDVSHTQNNGGETDLVAHHQPLTENTSKSPQHGISKKSSEFEAHIDHNGRHKLWNHEYGMYCECVTDETIVFKLEKELEQNLASTRPDFHSKESNQTSQVGHNFSLEALKNSLDPEGGLFVGGSIDYIGKQVCEVSPCLYISENWAGPAYANSPAPSSLPVPRFSMREMRSASLDLPPSPASSELSAGGLPSSHSAPPSPTRDAPQYTPPLQKLQGQRLSLDADFATKDLRRMLNLS